MMSTLLFQTQSLAILLLLGIGIYFRAKRKIHIRIMSTAITWDILLVLQIEFFRNAIVKASKALSNPFLLNLHICLAVMTILFYFALIYTGRQVLLNRLHVKKIHKKLGIGAILLRILTFITSLFGVESGQHDRAYTKHIRSDSISIERCGRSSHRSHRWRGSPWSQGHQ